MNLDPTAYKCVYSLVLSDKYYKEEQLSPANKFFKAGSQTMDQDVSHSQWFDIWEAVETNI
ncbi:hypothetical protein [Pseudomonas phage LUZ7]|uniref:Uncharacterized protein n=1 Tax=Pseudomonas phage LUZ7 TaxID=655097 RepID=C8ZKK7_9CAUD|nr:hypothetical protein PP-LUZ7_gp108 [Pseudomonas phage LUZ7]CAZ66249.1 hypothetical protein [Pseudomonas phage LUZ7]